MRQYGLIVLILGLASGEGFRAQTNQIDVTVIFTQNALTPAQMVLAAKSELTKAGVTNIETNACTVYVSLNYKACIVEFRDKLERPTHKVVFNENGKITQVNAGLIREDGISHPEWGALSDDEKKAALEYLKDHGVTKERVISEGTPPPPQRQGTE